VRRRRRGLEHVRDGVDTPVYLLVTMPNEPIRKHIEALASRSAAETSDLTSGIVRSCWPGGGEDRTQPAALAWVRRWRPEQLGAALPTCACAAGRCAVCN
jgi:hypothetical protein